MENQEMNENCIKAGKKKKKKKKKKVNSDSQQSTSTDPSQTAKESNCYFSVADMLPQKVGEKTVFKDLEVTLTEGSQSSGISIPVKEKKKPEQQADNPLASIVNSLASSRQTQQSSAATAPSSSNNHLRQSHSSSAQDTSANLAKNPDVSIIPCNSKVTESSAADNNQIPVSSDDAAPKKKKKKKKKKKASPEIPTSTTKNEDESVITPPTCVKLQAEGDSCVLLVSHESFGSNRSSADQQVCESSAGIGDGKGTIKITAASGIVTSVQNSQTSSSLHTCNAIPATLKPQFNEIPTDQEASLLKLASSSYIVPPHMPLYSQTTTSHSENSGQPGTAEAHSVGSVPKNDGITTCPSVPLGFQDDHSSQLSDPSIASAPSVAQAQTSVNNLESMKSAESVPNAAEGQPTKAQLRAARRAIQEAQRAAKLAAKSDIMKNQSCAVPDQVKQPTLDKPANRDIQKNLEKSVVKVVPAVSDSKPTLKEDSTKITQEKEKPRKRRMCSHLPQVKSFDVILRQFQVDKPAIHPAILAVGAQHAQGIICGSSARCVSLMSALKAVINDYVTPQNKEFSRDFADRLQMHMNFLATCRPLSVSMVNAVKFLQNNIRCISSEQSDNQAKEFLLNCIAKFVREEIILAKDAISSSLAEELHDGDVILTYGNSSVVKAGLHKTFSSGKKIRVIVVDSHPKLEGREMLRGLVKVGIPCTYTLINAASYVMKEVSIVILGAHAVQGNGYVISRIGNSQVALVAHAHAVPVVVCCESYKFCDTCHIDSFGYNELGDSCTSGQVSNRPQQSHLQNWKDTSLLQHLNLLYDVTPPKLVSKVWSEKGRSIPTAVQAILRARHARARNQP